MAIGQIPTLFDIVNLQTLEVDATVRLQGQRIQSFGISPDGKRVAVVLQGQNFGTQAIQILESAASKIITGVDPPGHVRQSTADAGPRLINQLKALGVSSAFRELHPFRDYRVREPARHRQHSRDS